MSVWNRVFVLAAFFPVIISSIYGCRYHGTDVVYVEPLDKEGHKQKPMSPGHARFQAGETGTVKDKYDTSGLISTVDKRWGIISIEKNAPVEVQVGKPLKYTINVANLTANKVKDVEVTETFSHKFKLKSIYPQAQKGAVTGIVRWFLGDFGPHETKEIQITGIPLEAGNMPFCTDVKYALPPLCIITVAVNPELHLSKQMPLDVLICDKIPITYVIKNTGTGAAKNVQIKESLPPGLRTLDGGSSIVQDVGVLQAGETRKVSVIVRADRTGKFESAATAVAEGGLSANSHTTITNVTQPELKITKSGIKKVYIGGRITYDIIVKNTGNGPALSTVIEESIPANATFLNATDGGTLDGDTVRWDLGTLQSQDFKKVSVTLIARDRGRARNIVTARAVCAETVSAEAVTDVLGIPAILLEVVDIKDPIVIGDTETYEITVTNQGSEIGTNIRVSCTLEKEMEYVSSSGATRGTLAGNTIDFEPLATLVPKAKASWRVIVKALQPGDVRFKVNMMEDCLTRPVEETEATHFYE